MKYPRDHRPPADDSDFFDHPAGVGPFRPVQLPPATGPAALAPDDLRILRVPDRPEGQSTPLADLLGRRPPWAWSNLDSNEAAQLRASLDLFVATYNRQYVMELDEVIPACWPLHPRLLHELPVLYWGWWSSHRDPKATSLAALEWYGRHLPGFQSRLSRLIGSGAASCRKGVHQPLTPDVEAAVQRYEHTDQASAPSDPTEITFGA